MNEGNIDYEGSGKTVIIKMMFIVAVLEAQLYLPLPFLLFSIIKNNIYQLKDHGIKLVFLRSIWDLT